MADEFDEASKVHETILPTLTLSVLGGVGGTEVDSLATPSGLPTPASAILRELSRAHPVDENAAKPERRGARRGDLIGHRYVVEGQIGRGGMGRVLRVRHQVLGKPFALKLIKAPIADKTRIREMFYREARLASALTHDNICSIVDFGEDLAFGLFMVMELLEGNTLHAKLRHDGRFAPKVACDIMWQIVEAVRYIHSRAIIHGDVKSENILLTRTPDRRRVVKLLDFGLARPDVAHRTERIEGTPEYLAPERIRSGATASTATDIYALGILFYEMLTGELPFRGTVEEIFRQHVDQRVPKVSERIDDPTFDERADEIIQRATAHDPDERHPDAGNFQYELRTLMNMLGMDVTRRRVGSVDPVVSARRGRLSNRERGGTEVFELAPIPLASVDRHGNVRVGNSAFLEFLGAAGRAAGLNLADSGLTEVYPALMDDLTTVLDKRGTIKRIIYLSEGGGVIVQVAVILTAASGDASVTAGEIHIALHPLARLQQGDQ